MCQCDLSSHLCLHLWRGRVSAASPLLAPSRRGFSHGSVHTAGLRSGGDSEELSLGMMSLQVACARGDRPGGDGVSGSHSGLLPALRRR